MKKLSAKITGTGSYLPEKVLTNFDLEKMVETSDEWIQTRTGIRERRVAREDQASSDLALEASRRALDDARVGVDELDLIMVATITPDQLFPSTACELQTKLGAPRAAAFDLLCACSGFTYATVVAAQFIKNGAARKVLIVGSECLTKITDYTDRTSCILFGDGAGAAVMEAAEGDCGLLHFELGADGSGGECMILPGGGSRIPTTAATLEQRLQYMKIRGREVYRFAVTKMSELVANAVKAAGISLDDVKLIIPHQVNLRILEAAAKRLGIDSAKFYVNIDRYGNTSAASIPIALDEARREKRFSDSDILIFVAFGGGLTWGSVVWKW
ncbi:MAG: beta-ketoacyl-ACP synthase III [Planctomycetota bacterium]